MHILLLFVLTALYAFAQAKPEAPRFEVVSVKPPPKVGQSIGRLGCTGNRFAFAGIPLTRLIQWAYDLPTTRIQGLPTWVTDYVNKIDSMYEIEAKAPAAVTDSQCKVMVQPVLADRFKMISHFETRELRAYALAVSKKGPKMRKASPGGTGPGVNFNGIPVRSVVSYGDAPPGISMAQLARRLSGVPILGLPVLDRTGLTGVYSFDLNFSTSEGDERPAITTAIEEQLGLKLKSIKAPIEVLVVDHIERPTAN